MGIFDRMSRVISSNFNALLDKADDPRKSIELLLEEMAAQIKAGRQEVVRAVAAEKQLRHKIEQMDAEAVKWSERAELAVKHGDDSLAREALLHQRRVVGERTRAEAMRAEQRGQALEMKAELERMESKVAELAARKGTLAAAAEQARSGGAGTGAPSVGGAAFADFRRMEAQIEGVEAAFQAQREVDAALGGGRGPGGLTPAEVEAKFRALEQGAPGATAADVEVDDELRALKRRVRVDG